MYRRLGSSSLKSGEPLEVGVVIAPDEEFAGRLKQLLSHKPPQFLWHIEQSLAQPLDMLETRFYVGMLGETIIANVMTVEHAGVGILGHVFTVPEHRRKGACTAVMKHLMDDFKRRGGNALTLGTGYDSPPYWIYHSFGFRSVEEGSGTMKFLTHADVEERYFAPRPALITEAKWHHWGPMNLLCVNPAGDYLRAYGVGLFGLSNFEGGFLSLLHRKVVRNEPIQWSVIETDDGAVVGFAILQPDARWRNCVWLLDFFVHPNFTHYAAELLTALKLPDAKVQCYTQTGGIKSMILGRLGFTPEATLARQLYIDNRWLDVTIWRRI